MSPLIRLVPLVLLLGGPVWGQEINEKAARYYESLQKRPVAGAGFERFVDAWLDTDTLEHLEGWLAEKVKRQPSATGHILLGLFYGRQGASARAVDECRAGLKLEPGNAGLWQQKAAAESGLLEFDEAIASLQKGLEQKPVEEVSLAMRQTLGRLLSRAGRTEEALTLWQKLMEERPGDEALREDVLDLQLAEGLFDAAVQNATALVERAPDAYKKTMRRLQLADVLDRAGRTDAALAEWERCLADSGTDSWLEKEVLERLERVFRRDDNLSGWRTHLEGLAQRYGQRSGLQRARVRLLAEQGEKSAAVEAGRAMLELAPGDRTVRDEYISLLVEAGRQTEAVTQLDELVRLSPADRELLLKLAGLKMQAGDKAGGLSTLLEYDKLSGADEAARMRSAALLEKAGLTAEAMAHLQAAAREFPDSVPVAQALAAALHRAKRTKEALREWRRLAATATGPALLEIARAMSVFGEDEAAQKLLVEKVTAESSDVLLLTHYCQLSERLGHADEALPHARRLLSLAQSIPDIQAALELASGLIERAGRVEEAMASIPAEAGAGDLCLLAELQEHHGDSAAAEETLRRLAKAAPELAAAQMVRLYRMRQAWPQALEAGARSFEAPGGRKAATAQMLVELSERSQDLDGALKWAREWHKLSPGAVRVILKESRLLRSLGREEESLKVLRLASSQIEENREIREELAHAYRDAGRAGDALAIYAGLLEQSADMTQKLRVVHEWAATAQEAGRLPEMLEQFEERRRRNREGTGPLLSLAEIYGVSGEREKQQNALTEAARLRPEDAGLALKLASMQQEDDRIPEAIGTLKNALPHDKSGRVRPRLAALYFAAGNQTEGRKLLEEIAEKNPPDAGAVESMVMTLADAEPARALALLRSRVQADPENYRLRYLLAVLMKENGEDAEALREWTRLLSVQKENPAVTARNPVPLLGASLEQKLQQLAGVVPDEILTALRTHETAVSTGEPQPVITAIRAVQKLFPKHLIRQPPDSIAELQALTVVALSNAFKDSPEEIRLAAQAALKREGREPLAELLARLPTDSLLMRAYGRHRETSDEPFPESTNDTVRGLHALLMLDIARLSVRRDICQEVWKKWCASHPDFALAAALAGMGQGKDAMAEWELEATKRLETVERPSPLVWSGAGRFLEGNRCSPGNFAQTRRVLERIAGWLEAAWVSAPAMNDDRQRMTRQMVLALNKVWDAGGETGVPAPEDCAAILARVLDAEWPRAGNAVPTFPVPVISGSSRSGVPQTPGLMACYSWPLPVIPGVSPVFANDDSVLVMTRERARRTAARVRTPALRALLEDRAAEARHPWPALLKLAADPAANAATLTLGAVSLAEAEKFDLAAALAVRALECTLSPEVRRLLNASLVSWAEDGMAAAGSVLHHAAHQAALRLRPEARSDNDKVALSGAMDSLGMNTEAAALIPGGGRGMAVTEARLVYSFRGKEGSNVLQRILKEQSGSKGYPSVAPVAGFLRRHARYLLSPAGWASKGEEIIMMNNTFDDDAGVVWKLLKDLKGQKEGERNRILAAMDPGPEGDAGQLAVFAAVNEILENGSMAANLYQKALAKGATDAGVRVRLGLLLWEAHEESVAEVFAAAPPEAQARLLESFLWEGKSEPLQRVLEVAAMVTAALGKCDPAAVMDCGGLNRLAQLLHGEHPIDESMSAPAIKGDTMDAPLSRENPRTMGKVTLTKARDLLTARRARLEALCRKMLSVPGTAAVAFSFLEDFPSTEASRIDDAETACVAESRPHPDVPFPRQFHCGPTRDGSGPSVELPGPERPLIFLLDAAVKSQTPAPLRDSLIPALQKAGAAPMAERVALLTDLCFRPPEEAEAIAKRLPGSGGEAVWKPAIRILTQRRLTIDLTDLLTAEINRARSRPALLPVLTNVMVDYCEWQCAAGSREHARDLLRRAVDVLAGPASQREAIIRGALWSSKMGAHGGFPGGWSLTSGRAALPSLPAQALVDLLKRLVDSPHCVLTASEVIHEEIMPRLATGTAAEFAVALKLDQAGFTKPEYFTDPERVRAFFTGSPMLAGVEDFRSWGGEGGIFMLAVEAMQSMNAGDLKPVMEFLKGQPVAFGRDLLMSATAEQWSAAPVNTAAAYLERIQALPGERRREMVEFLSALFSGRDRGRLTDKGVALLKWTQREEAQLLYADNMQRIQNWLNPRNTAIRMSEGPSILEAAIAGMSPRAYDVVRRTAQLAGSKAPAQVAALVAGGKEEKKTHSLPPDASAFRLGVLTNTVCAGDGRVPLFTDPVRSEVPRTAGWIADGLEGSTEERLAEFVRVLSPWVKPGEGCVMLEAFPLPVMDGDTPDGRATMRAAAIAWAEGAGKRLPRQDLVQEIAAAAALETFIVQRPGAGGITAEAALPPEQMHYLLVMRDEAVSLNARLAVAAVLADFAGPWLEPPLVVETANLLDKAVAARRPVDGWQRRVITLTVARSARLPALDAAALMLKRRLTLDGLNLQNEEDRRQAKAWLLLALREPDNKGAASAGAQLEKWGCDPEVLAMVLRGGHAESIEAMLHGAGDKFYNPARISGLEVFDQTLAEALGRAVTLLDNPFANMQVELAVNCLPSGAGMSSREDRLAAAAARMPAMLDGIQPGEREQLLELLTVEPVAALSLEKRYLEAVEPASLEALLRLNRESVRPQQVKFWMVLLCASAARGDTSEMTDRFDALTQLNGGEDSSRNHEALRHVCMGIAHGWPQWDETKHAVIRDWLARRKGKTALFRSRDDDGVRHCLELLPASLQEAIGVAER